MQLVDTPTPSTMQLGGSPSEELHLLSVNEEKERKDVRLFHQPESLVALLDLYMKERWEVTHYFCRLWITDDCYICEEIDLCPSDHESILVVVDSEFAWHCVRVGGRTFDAVVAGLEYLAGLSNETEEELGFWLDDDGILPCPFFSSVLSNLAVLKPNLSFEGMRFTPDQSRALATSGTRTRLQFVGCSFEDEGTAFVEAVVAQEGTGPDRMSFKKELPLSDDNFMLLLEKGKLEALVIENIRMSRSNFPGASMQSSTRIII